MKATALKREREIRKYILMTNSYLAWSTLMSCESSRYRLRLSHFVFYTASNGQYSEGIVAVCPQLSNGDGVMSRVISN